MKYPFAIALWLMSASTAAAENYLVPPPEYDPYIHPYKGRLTEVTVTDRNDMNKKYCAGNIAPLGCAANYPEEGACWIYILSAELLKPSKITVEEVRRHELAHCNGWKHPKPKMVLSKEDEERLFKLKAGETHIVKPVYIVPDVRHCTTPACYIEEWKKANP